VEETADSPVKTKSPSTDAEKKPSSGSEPKSQPKEVTALSLKSNAESPASESSIAVSPTGSIWNRPIGSSAVQVAEMISVAGDRPIASSSLEVIGTILTNRPIMASDIKVLNLTPIGSRPIFASTLVIRDDLTLPGGRPIIASDPKLMEATLLPGGRPIASNEIDDSETLMGFID